MKENWQFLPSLPKIGPSGPIFGGLMQHVLAHFYVKFDCLSNARNFGALAQLLREIQLFCHNTLICG